MMIPPFHHVYQLNIDVDDQNMSKLKDLALEDQHIIIRTIDYTKDKHTRQIDLTMPTSKANTGGLVGELHLAVGAKVMLTYMAKQEDIKRDLTMNRVDIMCFTETFLKPHQDVSGHLMLNKECTQVFKLDRVTTSSQDLSNGGIMIACATSLLPESTNISHSTSLEVKSVTLTSHCNLKICVVAVYRHPQLPMATFLPLLDNYLSRIPHQTMPTLFWETSMCQQPAHPNC